ncbi:Mitochondrial glycoprotein family protein [Striga hermonthica]|uniref:Mitochondrial glycoprotein family protein n=1 Tax=Striga hermonthica TaxID=68872 RepID=A0A9N7RQI0_STRHE|nr:Mitochondrial glycoprotein family protein [Striga hermonthica]
MASEDLRKRARDLAATVRGAMEEDGESQLELDSFIAHINRKGGELSNISGDGRLPREALMKICVKKPDMSSILQFDCVASNRGELDFDIQNAHCISSSKSFDSSTYRGPLFSDLDPSLQNGLRQYLAARGIEKNFANSLLIHLHNKEHGQYMNWLQKLTNMMMKNE